MKKYKICLASLLIIIGCSFTSEAEKTFNKDLEAINKLNEGYKTHTESNPFIIALPDSFRYRKDIVFAEVQFSLDDNMQKFFSSKRIVNDTAAYDFFSYQGSKMKNIEGRYDSAVYLGGKYHLEIFRYRVYPDAKIPESTYGEFADFSINKYDEKSGGIYIRVLRIIYLMKRNGE